jgi:hypothetical protein
VFLAAPKCEEDYVKGYGCHVLFSDSSTTEDEDILEKRID